MNESTKWYDQIRGDSLHYRHQFLSLLLGLGSLIPLNVLLEARRLGETAGYLPLAIVLCAFVISFLISIFSSDRIVEVLGTFVLAAIPLMYFFATLFPESHQTYVIILLCMPFIVDILAPDKYFKQWRLYYWAVALIAALLPVTGVAASRWSVDFKAGGFYTIYASFALLCMISGMVRRHSRKDMEKMESFIVTDRMTGLPSIIAYRETLLPARPTFVAVVCLDNFGEISTLFGYSFAGIALKIAANKLSEVKTSMNGSVFRLRNNDFGFVKPLAENEQAALVAQILLQSMAGPYVLQGKTIELNFRIGCTTVSDGNAEKALNDASEALQLAREAGLDIKVHTEDPEHARSVEAAMDDLVILSRNIVNKTLELFYQPVISLATGKVAWNEALLRLRKDGDGEYLEPARFIKLANATGHWTAVEDFVVKEAIGHAEKPGGSVSINVGLRDFDRPDFIEAVARGMESANADGSQIILEILEDDFGRASENRLAVIQKLRSAGCLVAIDDFGIGFSNYSRLVSFPVDIVKFDRFLVQKACMSEDIALLLEKLTNFCNDNGMLTVAEGIEDEKCAELLTLMGIDFGQGFFWAKALREPECWPADPKNRIFAEGLYHKTFSKGVYRQRGLWPISRNDA